MSLQFEASVQERFLHTELLQQPSMATLTDAFLADLDDLSDDAEAVKDEDTKDLEVCSAPNQL